MDNFKCHICKFVLNKSFFFTLSPILKWTFNISWLIFEETIIGSSATNRPIALVFSEILTTLTFLISTNDALLPLSLNLDWPYSGEARRRHENVKIEIKSFNLFPNLF